MKVLCVWQASSWNQDHVASSPLFFPSAKPGCIQKTTIAFKRRRWIQAFILDGLEPTIRVPRGMGVPDRRAVGIDGRGVLHVISGEGGYCRSRRQPCCSHDLSGVRRPRRASCSSRPQRTSLAPQRTPACLSSPTVKTAGLLLSGSMLFGAGGCLPENYFGNLLTSITTGAADLAVEAAVTTVLQAIGLVVPLQNV